MRFVELLSAVVGSFFALASILVDIAASAQPNRLGAQLDLLSRRIWIRTTVAPRDNLRQILAVAGSVVLLTLAILSSSAVYAALEILMLVSKVLWFIPFGDDEALSDKRKAALRVIAAVGTWLMLEAFGLCSGFHRIGVVGLEVLGCAYALQSPLARNQLMVLGSAVLVAYAALGTVLEPHKLINHATLLFLNGVFLALALINHAALIRKSRELLEQFSE